MAFDPYLDDFDYPQLEHDELDRRLHHLAWPDPPPGARERCLQRILASAPLNAGPGGAPPFNGEHVERHALTRHQPEPPARPARTRRWLPFGVRP
jgi:hypothetical protein